MLPGRDQSVALSFREAASILDAAKGSFKALTTRD